MKELKDIVATSLSLARTSNFRRPSNRTRIRPKLVGRSKLTVGVARWIGCIRQTALAAKSIPHGAIDCVESQDDWLTSCRPPSAGGRRQ